MPSLHRTALIMLLALAAPAWLRADDVLHLDTVAVDRPTLVTLGVQLLISGDDDHDAQVGVRYRAVGAPTWNTGLDLRRVRPEHVGGRVVAAQFAGSIFDLSPATAYEIELHAIDADGAVDQTVTAFATTRALPHDPASPVPVAVSTSAQLQAALDAAQPGHVITLQPGIYRGPFALGASGTAADPIVVRGADQDGVVLDGNRCSCNLLEITGSFVHVENLTVQNALRAVRLKGSGTTDNVLRHVRLRDVTNAIIGDPDQRDFYLCDNVLEGRLVWPAVYGNDGGRHANDDGINVQGDGHVVCHNRIVGFGDAMKNEGIGARADDFYGNEVLSAYDNGIEFDFSEGNVRAFRNRFTNTFVPLSFQPVYGGPVYALRNVVVNVAEDQLKLYTIGGVQQPSGVVVWHNTFVSPGQALLMGSADPSHDVTIENNLFIGAPTLPPVTWIGPIDNGVIDWNGWSPDGMFNWSSAGSWPNFAAMQAAGVFESHGRLLAPGTFASGLTPPSSYTVTLAPQDVTLASGSNAIDAARVLPNVNDHATGAAPDLGALERDCPLPLFGVRPAGVDETNEPTGCGGPTVTTTTLPYVTIQTSSLKLKDSGTPSNRRLAFKSSTTRDPLAYRIVPPAFGGAGDPTLHGAVLTLYNAAGGTDLATVTLPAAGWSHLGSNGYAYRSSDPTAAISSVKVQPDRLQVKGGRANLTYTLDEPAQKRVAVRLALGSELTWCAAALARIAGTPPSSAKNDRPGLFVAQPKMAAPLTCPPTP